MIFALVIGLAMLALTPVAARQMRLWTNARLVSGYLDAANALSLLDCGTLLTQAKEYNAAHGSAVWTDPYAPDPGEGGDVLEASPLDPMGNGVISVLELPKLGATLPVYRGDVPTTGARVVHLPQSSLPVANTGSRCALYATRDRFFDPFSGLDRLIAGDCFCLRVLQGTLTYEVFQVAVVGADTLDGQRGDGSADECALIAETGDGQRLVVRGRRVSARMAISTDDTRVVPDWASGLVFAAPVALPGMAALAIIEGLQRAVRRRKRRHMRL